MTNCPERPERLPYDHHMQYYRCDYCGMMLLAGHEHPETNEADNLSADEMIRGRLWEAAVNV